MVGSLPIVFFVLDATSPSSVPAAESGVLFWSRMHLTTTTTPMPQRQSTTAATMP